MSQPHSNPDLAEAVDMFVMRRFDECFDTCCTIIKRVKCDPEHERNLEVIEASSALGIQALAETDRWTEAVAFILGVYETVEMCPPRIIQICILLHAHVKEYLLCHKLVYQWLQNAINLKQREFPQVIRTFVHHILGPSGDCETLKELVCNCNSLTQKEKDSLLVEFAQTCALGTGSCKDTAKLSDEVSYQETCRVSQIQHFQTQAQETNEVLTSLNGVDTHEKITTSNDQKSDTGDQNVNRTTSQGLTKVCRRLSHFVTQAKYWNNRFGLLIMAVLAVLGLIHSQTGDPVSSLSRLVILWKGLLLRLGFTFFE